MKPHANISRILPCAGHNSILICTQINTVLGIHLIPNPTLNSCTLSNIHLYAGHTTFTASGTQWFLLTWPPSFLSTGYLIPGRLAQCSAGNPGAPKHPGLLTLVEYADPQVLAHPKPSSRISPTLELKFPPYPPLGSCLPNLEGASAALEPPSRQEQAGTELKRMWLFQYGDFQTLATPKTSTPEWPQVPAPDR